VELGPEETRQIMATPSDAKHPPESREAVERAAEMLGEVGITWVPAVDVVLANQAARVADRRKRAVTELGELGASLFERVRDGDAQAVQKLLAAGADVNARTIEDQFEWTPIDDTPLLQAIKKAHEDVVDILLAAGADIHAVNSYGQSPVYWAVRERLMRTVEALHARGADLARPDSSGWTPLHWAAADGFDDMIRFLLQAGVPKEPRNRNGHRPIDVATLRGQADVILLLS
jgi:ankyrin repeat protein